MSDKPKMHQMLRDAYDNKGVYKNMGKVTAVHMFGIKHSGELSYWFPDMVVSSSGIPKGYKTTLRNGISLGQYVYPEKPYRG